MDTTTISMPDIVGYVLELADEDGLNVLTQAVSTRRRVLKERAAAEITVNASVTLYAIAPKYLVGLEGTVKTITLSGKTRTATVTLTEESTLRLARSSTKYQHLFDHDFYDLPGVPLTCCKVTVG